MLNILNFLAKIRLKICRKIVVYSIFDFNFSETAYSDETSRRRSLKRFFPTGCDGLEMIADSVEGIRRLADELFYSDLENSKKDNRSQNSEIIEALRKLEANVRSEEDNCIRRRNEIRIKLFSEWTENCAR